jgi:hypothetical protein
MLLEEQQQILSEFPNIKLSYEKLAHKKVSQCDFMLAIPKGQKCFIWFTEYEDKNICFLLELGERKEITNIQSISISFHTELVYNTIIYGTLFYEKKMRLFAVDNIFYYKGQDVSQNTWLDKFSIITKMLENDIEYKSNSSFLYFGLPILSNNYNDLIAKTKEVNYRIDTIQFRLSNKTNYYLTISFYKAQMDENSNISNTVLNSKINKSDQPETMKNNNVKITTNINSQYEKKSVESYSKREMIFKIRPDIQNDIYHLYCLNEQNEEVLFDTAFIPNFTTSVMMNKLFRNIKENNNLDALEESDDEDEFENGKEDRFVYLDKSYNMVCAMNHKFKKWYPVKVAPENSVIVQHKVFRSQNK